MQVTFPLGSYGRLGNQLFQIAATIGIAAENNARYVFPPWPFSRFWRHPIPQSKSIPVKTKLVATTHAYQEIEVTQSTCLVGFFQSEKYFSHVEKKVRYYFTPHPKVLRDAFNALKKTLPESAKGKRVCALHIRRGDYVRHPEFVDLAATDYYQLAIEEMVTEPTHFVIFSDEPDWCRTFIEALPFRKSVTFMQGSPEIIDLLAISLCDDVIIANSSFSWWGAWLNWRDGRRVIAPREWFSEYTQDLSEPYTIGSEVTGYLDTSDIIPERWRVIATAR